MSQGKLVRDKIPQVIKSEGLEPIIYTVIGEEWARPAGRSSNRRPPELSADLGWVRCNAGSRQPSFQTAERSSHRLRSPVSRTSRASAKLDFPLPRCGRRLPSGRGRAHGQRRRCSYAPGIPGP